MLTTNQKGLVAESAVMFECAKLGIGVSRPLNDERYDLIFDLRGNLMRVQCKWASRHGDVIVVPLYANRRAAEGLRRTYYTRDEVDAFAAYCAETSACYFFRFGEVDVKQELSLRLAPTRNGQASGIRWARDFEFGATIERLLGP
jgi:PD-(D/E)XK endonuclease